MTFDQMATYKEFWLPVSAAFALLAVLSLTILAYQALALNKIRRLEVDDAMVKRITANIDLLAPLYAKVCDDGFQLKVDTLSQQQERDVLTLARDFVRVGTLFLTGAFDTSVMLHLHADLCIRVWLFVLEPYVKRERERRRDPSWMWQIQHFLVLSLEYRVRTPSGGVAIYHPANAVTIHKEYLREELKRILVDTKGELKRIRPRSRRGLGLFHAY